MQANALGLQSLQWRAGVPAQFSAGDAACLAEVRAVLARHGNLDRFGVARLQHELVPADDEILLETTNAARRELLVRPVKRSELAARGIESQATVLRFDHEGWAQHCGCYPHNQGHGHS